MVGRDTKTGGGGSIASGTASQVSRMNSVNVYDLKNKFIGWSGVINDVTHVVCEWGSIFIVTGDRQIFQLEEKDTSTKLDMVGGSLSVDVAAPPVLTPSPFFDSSSRRICTLWPSTWHTRLSMTTRPLLKSSENTEITSTAKATLMVP